MSSSTRLFDSNGHLLPPEQCNIEPLDSLTKHRAASPSRRSPSRNGRQSAGTSGSEPKLPNFVQEVTKNTESPNIRLASPTAIKAEYVNVEKRLISTKNSAKDGTHLANNHLGSTTASNFKASVLSKSKALGKMESGIVNEAAFALELMEKPVPTWTMEDVGIWLDDIGLSKFKEHFLIHKVSGKTLLNLSYETLEKLNLSESSEEREHFLSEVYRLQEESGQVDNEDEQMMDKEIEETLRDVSPQENNNEQTHVHVPVSTGSDLTPTDSFASSSRTESDIGPSPTSEITDNGKQKQDSPKKTVVQNKAETSTHTITSNQVSPTKTKSKKESSKPTSKKAKPRGKRISRLFNSKPGSHKDPSLLHTAPPIYKNAFHNLMNTGPQGVVKVWTEMFLTDMQYVSLLIKHEDTAFEVIKMVLEKSNAKEDPECYRICEINEHKKEYVLDRNECPLQRERQWSDPDNCRFELRWRNERLIEWGNSTGPIAQDLSKQKISEEPSSPQNHIEAQQDKTSSPSSSESTSGPDSPGTDDLAPNNTLETEFAYIVEVDHGKGSSTNTGKSEKDSDMLQNNSQNDLTSNIEDPDSIQNAPKRLVSSCPDLSQNDSVDDDPEYGNLMISKNFNFLNAESDLMGIDNGPTTNLDSSSDASTSVGEFEYSQQLRRSSKRLSDRLRFQGKPRIEGQAVEIGIDAEKQDDLSTLRDTNGDKRGETGDNVGISLDRTQSNNDLSIDVSKDIQQDLSASVPGDVSRESVEEPAAKQPGDEAALKETEDVTAPKEPGNEVSTPVVLPEVSEVLERINELQNENSLLIEDNRELKKQCRTFEGKSRLRERELEEMESEKNELANQVQEMATELHSLRAANTELRTEVDEANTKLSDVDGWVTRDVFEDIRGQLSLSAEECEKRDEEISEIQKKCKNLEVENKKMHDLAVEVEKLNERIKEDNKVLDEVKRDLKGKEKRILQLELETQKMENSLQEKENEKEEKENKLQEVEIEMEGSKKNHENEKKDLQKRLSDREYEILIMKEEKKELCIKMKGFENNVETLREELKTKDEEREAAIAEMEKQSAIKDESLSVMVSNLEECITERDLRIKQLKKQIALSVR
ncbi:predicted protein [Paramuricea clavata]|uniref:Uncharacterized protein n=1 Tax=Paramuricea clavata TaxID=317549 RepID=A0A6S7GTB1_PARCT|nr:predicted protein [Paramuricea clavata]